MPTYTIQHGDTLPRVAEKLGHSGEWQALVAANLALVADYPELDDAAKAALIAERMTVGVELDVPVEWVEREAPAESGGTVVPASSMSAAELIALANSAQTLDELDAIDAAAAGRVTVNDAVDARRATLLGQGVTA
jgi:hypothetical protein